MSVTFSKRRSMRVAAPFVAFASVCLMAGQALAVGTSATPTTNPTAAAAGWLSTQLSDSSNLPAPGGDHFGATFSGTYYPDYGTNADLIFGLAASKSGASTATRALHALEANIESYADPAGTSYGPYDGSLAKAALAAIVMGQDPTTSFGSYNVMQIMKADEKAGVPANIYSQFADALVVLAEARVGGVYAPSPAAVQYLLTFQCADGGFTSDTDPNTYALLACGHTGASDPDTTAFAVMALQATDAESGTATYQPQIDAAVAWLQKTEVNGQYWVNQGSPNVDSTGLAAAALAGQGKDISGPQTWLASQQVAAGQPGAGALKYAGTFKPTTASGTSFNVLGTAQGLLGMASNGSLATLTAAGSSAGVGMLAPVSALSTSTATAGKALTVTAGGFAAGEQVQIDLHSTAVALATVKAAGDGTVKASVTIPASAVNGAHEIVLTGQSSGLVATSPLTLGSTATNAVVVGPKVNTGGSVETATSSDDSVVLVLAGAGLLAIAGGAGFMVKRRKSVRVTDQ